MPRITILVFAIATVALGAPVSLQAQFPPDSFTNLKVLPRDIPPDTLVRMMAGFTRALGVRCTHCHVGEEGQPLETYDFAADDKAPKEKARVMIEMLGRINGQHLASLKERVDPPLRVECVTCHRGVREPRQLQEILLGVYSAAGLDSAISVYQNLRQRYHGRAAYDFGEVALADVATAVGRQGELGDAERIHTLNIEMNPGSNFAKNQHLGVALRLAFGEGGASVGRARYAELKTTYPANFFQEQLLNQVGYALLGSGKADAAVAAFELNVELYPQSANVYDSLGEGLTAVGDIEGAIRNYERSLELEPNNTNAVEKLRELKKK
jgi:tetratricopeptide (TPR) repeat protein